MIPQPYHEKDIRYMAGPVRARDLRRNIKDYGFERGTVITLELLLDEFAAMRQAVVDLADLQSSMIDRVFEMTQVGDEMKKRISAIQRKEDQHDAARGEGITPHGE